MPAEKSIEIVRDKKSPDRLLMMMLEAEGAYVSGEELSRKFGVSRSAIWKQANHLREMGYGVEASTRLGYRIFKSPALLLPEEIWSKTKLSFLGDRIYYYSTIGSTNSKARRLAQEGASHGTLVIAEEQTMGKGRMGRAWSSPAGEGIWISILLKPQMAPSEAAKLTMLTAVAVAEAINEKTGIPAAIKWPNDILIGYKKVCGILTEMSAEIDAVNYVVIGVGINVNNSTFPDELKDKATSLKIAGGKNYERLQILTGLLQNLEQYYESAMSGGFEDIFERWRKLCCHLGRRVEIITANGVFSGIAVDIDEQGALMVKKNDGKMEKVLSGDVSLKPVEE